MPPASRGWRRRSATGTVTVTAAMGTIQGSTTLNVTPATLVSIAVTPANSSMANGTSRQFTATGTYTDNSTQNLTAAVLWSSSNAGVAAVSNAQGSNGFATALGQGTATIGAAFGERVRLDHAQRHTRHPGFADRDSRKSQHASRAPPSSSP